MPQPTLASLLRLAFILFIAMALGRPAGAADWPQWRGVKRDGISAETGWSPAKPAVLWRGNVGLGFASVSIADGRLYTIGHEDGKEIVHCLDAATGEKKWTFEYPCGKIANLYEGGPNSTPTVDGANVYVSGKEGQLFCLDAAKGTKMWEVAMKKELGAKVPDWGFSSSPLILGELVIVQANCTAAFNKNDGKLVWKSEPFQQAYGSAVAFDYKGKTLIADLNSSHLIVLDAADGKVLAKTPWRTQFDTSAATPIVVGDKIFISTGYGKGCGLFEFTGDSLKQLYANTHMANHMNSCVLHDGHLYGIHGNSHARADCMVVCIDFATGERKWTQKGLGCGAVTLAGDKLIITSDRGDLVFAEASPAGFKEVGRLDQAVKGRCWTPPVFANGRVYVRSAPGDLACVELKR